MSFTVGGASSSSRPNSSMKKMGSASSMKKMGKSMQLNADGDELDFGAAAQDHVDDDVGQTMNQGGRSKMNKMKTAGAAGVGGREGNKNGQQSITSGQPSPRNASTTNATGSTRGRSASKKRGRGRGGNAERLPINICWFRRNLRLYHDNPAVIEAFRDSKDKDIPLLCLYCISPYMIPKGSKQKRQNLSGTGLISASGAPNHDACGVQWWNFLLSSLKELQQELETATHGRQTLYIANGVREMDLFLYLFDNFAVNCVFMEQDLEPYGLQRDDNLRHLADARDVKFVSYASQMLYDVRDVFGAEERNKGKKAQTNLKAASLAASGVPEIQLPEDFASWVKLVRSKPLPPVATWIANDKERKLFDKHMEKYEKQRMAASTSKNPKPLKYEERMRAEYEFSMLLVNEQEASATKKGAKVGGKSEASAGGPGAAAKKQRRSSGKSAGGQGGSRKNSKSNADDEEEDSEDEELARTRIPKGVKSSELEKDAFQNMLSTEIPNLKDMKLHKSEMLVNARHKDAGEAEALKRLEYFIKRDPSRVLTFDRNKQNPILRDSDYKFYPSSLGVSPFLAMGSLSVRMLYHEVRTLFEEENAKGKKNEMNKTPQVLENLLWRDYFYMCGFAVENFGQLMHNKIIRQMPWTHDTDYMRRWEMGKTGYPFIDAIMNQLRSEGWVPGLLRQVACCFLTRGNLYQSWERGRDVFAKYAIDNDWALNTGGWILGSCSCFDETFQNVFSPTQIGKEFDPNGDYIRYFVPALRNLPKEFIYEPWNAPEETQEQAGCILGKQYPNRICIHEETAAANFEITLKSMARELKRDWRFRDEAREYVWFGIGKPGAPIMPAIPTAIPPASGAAATLSGSGKANAAGSSSSTSAGAAAGATNLGGSGGADSPSRKTREAAFADNDIIFGKERDMEKKAFGRQKERRRSTAARRRSSAADGDASWSPDAAAVKLLKEKGAAVIDGEVLLNADGDVVMDDVSGLLGLGEKGDDVYTKDQMLREDAKARKNSKMQVMKSDPAGGAKKADSKKLDVAETLDLEDDLLADEDSKEKSTKSKSSKATRKNSGAPKLSARDAQEQERAAKVKEREAARDAKEKAAAGPPPKAPTFEVPDDGITDAKVTEFAKSSKKAPAPVSAINPEDPTSYGTYLALPKTAQDLNNLPADIDPEVFKAAFGADLKKTQKRGAEKEEEPDAKKSKK